MLSVVQATADYKEAIHKSSILKFTGIENWSD